MINADNTILALLAVQEMGVLRQQEQGVFCYICWSHGTKRCIFGTNKVFKA